MGLKVGHFLVDLDAFDGHGEDVDHDAGCVDGEEGIKMTDPPL